MDGPWICQQCVLGDGDPIIRHESDRVEKRVEFTSPDRKRRYRTVTVERMCRRHAEQEADRLAGLESGSEQIAMEAT